jgi:hypothetical protein
MLTSIHAEITLNNPLPLPGMPTFNVQIVDAHAQECKDASQAQAESANKARKKTRDIKKCISNANINSPAVQHFLQHRSSESSILDAAIMPQSDVPSTFLSGHGEELSLSGPDELQSAGSVSKITRKRKRTVTLTAKIGEELRKKVEAIFGEERIKEILRLNALSSAELQKELDEANQLALMTLALVLIPDPEPDFQHVERVSESSN